MAETKYSFYGSTAVPDDLKFKKSLVYPMDLGPDNFYPDCICFTIQKRTGVSIADVTAAGSAGIDQAQADWEGVPVELQALIKKEIKYDKFIFLVHFKPIICATIRIKNGLTNSIG